MKETLRADFATIPACSPARRRRRRRARRRSPSSRPRRRRPSRRPPTSSASSAEMERVREQLGGGDRSGRGAGRRAAAPGRRGRRLGRGRGRQDDPDPRRLPGPGGTEPVTSPTFTLGQRYGGGRLPVSHLDLYRLQILEGEDPALLDDYLGADGVAFVEWPAAGAGRLGRPALEVRLAHAGGERARRRARVVSRDSGRSQRRIRACSWGVTQLVASRLRTNQHDRSSIHEGNGR